MNWRTLTLLWICVLAACSTGDAQAQSSGPGEPAFGSTRGAVAPSQADVVGVWVRPLMSDSPNPPAQQTYELRADGSCLAVVSVDFSLTYQHSGELVVLHDPAAPPTAFSRWKVQIHGNDLRLQQVQPLQTPSCPFIRNGGIVSPQDLLIGSWKSAGCSLHAHRLSEFAIVGILTSDMSFGADGKAQVHSHVEFPGSYRVQGRTVAVSCVVPDRDGNVRPSEYKYSVHNGVPILQSGKEWDRFVKN